MGLDSIVELRSKSRITSFPEWVKVNETTSAKGYYIYELSYFRKCWKIHSIMLGLSCADGCSDLGSWESEYPDLEQYRDELISIFSDPDGFNDLSQVFNINEELEQIGQSILNCNWAIMYLKEHHDAWVAFIDSY